ncbi:serine/threonine protein kinase [Pendulispora brunnea]|uniref:Serine/threonine protein kinase n=1 Tax=Pendulispora brunnea TaxID=2905690 RepID=A0ABZ2JWQ7_9BACT
MSFIPSPAPERALARIGHLVQGKYRIRRLLGMGGSSAVYAATHRNGHEVAIKFLLPHLVGDEDAYRLFRREAYVANRVGHPGTVPVLDDDVDEQGIPFLIMPLLEGETLRTRLRRMGGRMPLAETCVLMADALDVLASAHAKGIVHRDIKPENLFLTREGTVRVMDFGIARRGDPDATLTLAGRIVGTPAFMPPEQAVGDRTGIGPHSDCWAAGATLFLLLSGETVHLAATAGALLVAAATQHARPLASVAGDVPHSVASVVDRALAFEPEKRWSSAQNMREALLTALESVSGESAAETGARVHVAIAADLTGAGEDPSDGDTQVPRQRTGSDVHSGQYDDDGEARILHCGDGIALAQIHELYVSIWLGGPPSGSFSLGRSLLRETLRDRKNRIAWLCIIGPDVTLEEGTLRQVSAEIESYGEQILCASAVVLGDGIRADMNRSTLSGMAVILSRRLPAATFPSVPAALQWMTRHVTIDPLQRTEHFVEQLTRKLNPTLGPAPQSMEIALPGGRILHLVEGFATGTLGRLHFAIWEWGPAEAITNPHAGIEEAIRNEPGGIGHICMIGPGAKMTESTNLRAAASAALHADHLRCLALVYRSESTTEVTEQINSGTSLMLTSKLPVQHFPSVREAVAWMADYVPIDSIDETVHRLERLRRDIASLSGT